MKMRVKNVDGATVREISLNPEDMQFKEVEFGAFCEAKSGR